MVTMRQAAYRRAMHKAVTATDIAEVIAHMLEVAKGRLPVVDQFGTERHAESIAAARLVLEYTIGKPPKASDEVDDGRKLIIAAARALIQREVAPHLADEGAE